MLESVRHNVSITDRVKQTKYLYFADRNVKYYWRIQLEFESFLNVSHSKNFALFLFPTIISWFEYLC